MNRALLTLRPWLIRLFLLLVPVSLVVDLPLWAVFVPLVVAFLVPARRVDDAEPIEVESVASVNRSARWTPAPSSASVTVSGTTGCVGRGRACST